MTKLSKWRLGFISLVKARLFPAFVQSVITFLKASPSVYASPVQLSSHQAFAAMKRSVFEEVIPPDPKVRDIDSMAMNCS